MIISCQIKKYIFKIPNCLKRTIYEQYVNPIISFGINDGIQRR